MPYFFNLIFCKMRNTNNSQTGVTYTDNFAFRFVGFLISHDKRMFETLHEQLLTYQEPLLETDFMNDKQERQAYNYLLEMMRELSMATQNLSDQELQAEFVQVLALLSIKKEMEVSHA
jgi:hypothetical protein